MKTKSSDRDEGKEKHESIEWIGERDRERSEAMIGDEALKGRRNDKKERKLRDKKNDVQLRISKQRE